MQSSIEYPASLTDKYRPRTVSDFVGLDKAKKIFGKFASAPYPSAWLFVGAPGTGKTSLALALAEQLGADLHHIPSQACNVAAVEETIRMCHYVPRNGLKSFHLVLVDEADRMSNAAQLAFLSKLDATAFPPSTIFVFTCNSTEGLEARFLSRCRQIEFSTYGMASDASALLAKVWQSETPTESKAPNFGQILRDSRNNIREALLSLETEILAA
jgi:replication-associated recombination protein RarA